MRPIQGRAASFFWFVEITIVNCGWQKKVSPLSFWGRGDLGSKEFWKLFFQAVFGELGCYLGGYFRCWEGDWDYDIFAFHTVAAHVDLEGSTHKALQVVGLDDGQYLLKCSFGRYTPNQRFCRFFACRNDKLILNPLVASFECGGSPDRIGYDPDLVDFSDFGLEKSGQLSSVLVHCFPYRHFLFISGLALGRIAHALPILPYGT